MCRSCVHRSCSQPCSRKGETTQADAVFMVAKQVQAEPHMTLEDRQQQLCALRVLTRITWCCRKYRDPNLCVLWGDGTREAAAIFDAHEDVGGRARGERLVWWHRINVYAKVGASQAWVGAGEPPVMLRWSCQQRRPLPLAICERQSCRRPSFARRCRP